MNGSVSVGGVRHGVPKKTRRTFSAEYKMKIIDEAAACKRPGEIGRLLKREGLYHSHLMGWRRVARSGALEALGKKRGPKPSVDREAAREIRELKLDWQQLVGEVEAAKLTIKAQRTTCREAGHDARDRERFLMAAKELAKVTGVVKACANMQVSRSTLRRRGQPKPEVVKPRPSPPRTLPEAERQRVYEILCSERFMDQPPDQVYATLLDEGTYLCSSRTMYRILRENKAVRERRPQRSHPKREKPHVEASRPNQSWCWDITRLRGEGKSTFYYLYVIMDLYSRYVVGWMLADAENATSAMLLIRKTCERQKVNPGQLTLHSDRGAPMTADCMVEMLDELGVNQSFSRPRVSNDNPYAEALFKTLKYGPDYPGRFADINGAKGYCREFFRRYNEEHHHKGIRLLTPKVVHSGEGPATIEKRQKVLNDAFAAHPERFVSGAPVAKPLPTTVEINQVLPTLETDANMGSEEVASIH